MKAKFLLVAAVSLVLAACGVQSVVSYYDHQPVLVNIQHDGACQIRVAGNGNNLAAAKVEAQKNAVNEVLFKGLNSSKQSLKPVVAEVNARSRYNDYFNKFFADGGDYKKFVTLMDNQKTAGKYVKNQSQVQCHVNVTVDVEGLKAKLREDKIIK